MTATVVPPPFGDGAGWRLRAACTGPGVDPEWFFPTSGQQGTRAKRVCVGCPVRADCLADALAGAADGDRGIRGGLTAAARRRLRRGQPIEGRAR